jgi:hypothetical protein
MNVKRHAIFDTMLKHGFTHTALIFTFNLSIQEFTNYLLIVGFKDWIVKTPCVSFCVDIGPTIESPGNLLSIYEHLICKFPHMLHYREAEQSYWVQLAIKSGFVFDEATIDLQLNYNLEKPYYVK